jgi:hypothetical protein
MWTKRQLIEQAYDELALAGYVYDLTPEELQSALRIMDTMLAQWEGAGIRIGYVMPATPDASDIDGPSGVPDSANAAIYANLAVRRAAGMGKGLTPATLRLAREGYAALLVPVAMPQKQQMPSTLPVGAGNRRPYGFRRTFYPPPCRDPFPTGQGGDLDDSKEFAP